MRTRSILLTAALAVGLLASAPNALQAQIEADLPAEGAAARRVELDVHGGAVRADLGGQAVPRAAHGARPSTRTNSAPIRNACASPSGLGCSAYSK